MNEPVSRPSIAYMLPRCAADCRKCRNDDFLLNQTRGSARGWNVGLTSAPPASPSSLRRRRADFDLPPSQTTRRDIESDLSPALRSQGRAASPSRRVRHDTKPSTLCALRIRSRHRLALRAQTGPPKKPPGLTEEDWLMRCGGSAVGHKSVPARFVGWLSRSARQGMAIRALR